MKDIKFALLLVTLFMYNALQGQVKNPIEFLDYEVEWFHEPWVDTLSVYDQDYSLVRDVIIQDDFMIAAYTQFAPAPFGFLLERINLNSGELDWSYNVFSEEKYTRSVIKDFELKDDTLALYLFKESETNYNAYYPNWDSCHVATLKLDVNNGEVLEYIGTDHSDIKNTLLFKDYFLGSDQVLLKKDNVYSIYKTEEKNRIDSVRYEDFILLRINNQGHLLGTDTLTISFPRFSTTTNQNFGLDEHTYISHIDSPYLPTSHLDYFSAMVVMDSDLQSFDSIHLHQHYNHDSLVYIGVLLHDEEKFLIETAGRFSRENGYIQKYFLFDYRGNLLNKHENIINRHERGEVILPYAFTEDNKILGIGRYQDFDSDSLTHLFFWETNSSNGIDTILDFQLKEKDISVALIMAYITHDNDLLLYCNYRQPSYPSEHIGPTALPPNWYFWIKIDGEDLGLKTSVEDLSIDQKSFEIKPNPATDNIILELEIPTEGLIHIQAQSGKRVKSIVQSLHQATTEIDISELIPGIYIVSIESKDNRVYSQKFIKI